MKFLIENSTFEIDDAKLERYPETFLCQLVENLHLGVLKSERTDRVRIDRKEKFFGWILELYDDPINKFCDHLMHIEKDQAVIEEYLNEVRFYGFDPSSDYRLTPCTFPEFHSRVESRLRDLGLTNLVSGVKHLEGCIIGSFILQCIYNEKWESDIDIYVKASSFETFRSDFVALQQCFLAIFGEIVSDIQELNAENTTYIGYASIIRKIIKFKLRDTHIDLVLTKESPRTAVKQAQFAFNRIFYDGYTLYSYDWKSIQTKSCKIHLEFLDTTSLESTIVRIRKYLLRGFRIHIDHLNDSDGTRSIGPYSPDLFSGNANACIWEQYTF